MLKRLKSKPASLNPAITDFFSGPFGSLHFLRNTEGQVSGFLLDAGRVRGVRFEKNP